MKKYLLSFLTMMTSVMLVAQEEAAESGRTSFSDDTKWNLVYVFAIVIAVLVIRTFRNKPTV